jgi:hypothetical protein
MVVSIDVTDINGTLPFSVYTCDEYFNNCQLTYTITDPVYWPVQFDIPQELNGSNTVILQIIDSVGCETFKVFSCS